MTTNEQSTSTVVTPVETEVRQKRRPRSYTAEYKRRIVEEVNQAPRGGIAVILRREGLYTTTVETWRKDLASSFEPRKRGRKVSEQTALKKDLQRLQQENERLKRKLEHAELIIDVQKKVARMLNMLPENSDEY